MIAICLCQLFLNSKIVGREHVHCDRYILNVYLISSFVLLETKPRANLLVGILTWLKYFQSPDRKMVMTVSSWLIFAWVVCFVTLFLIVVYHRLTTPFDSTSFENSDVYSTSCIWVLVSDNANIHNSWILKSHLVLERYQHFVLLQAVRLKSNLYSPHCWVQKLSRPLKKDIHKNIVTMLTSLGFYSGNFWKTFQGRSAKKSPRALVNHL